jgi:hypothetical protein
VLPTLLAALASGAGVLLTVLTASAAVEPQAGPQAPVVPVVRPPVGVDGPPLLPPTR